MDETIVSRGSSMSLTPPRFIAAACRPRFGCDLNIYKTEIRSASCAPPSCLHFLARKLGTGADRERPRSPLTFTETKREQRIRNLWPLDLEDSVKAPANPKLISLLAPINLCGESSYAGCQPPKTGKTQVVFGRSFPARFARLLAIFCSKE